MSLPIVKLTEKDYVFIRDGGENGIGCGCINDDGYLYFIDKNKGVAHKLPNKYKDTPIILYHPCGGYQEGLIMVSLLGKIHLQYHHDFYDTAGMWGWIDLEGNEVIRPQYVYAMSFYGGRAIVCKGEWTIDDNGEYWCDDEQWGIIDTTGREIVPCRYDEIYEIDDIDRFILCHKGGWEKGCYVIYDVDKNSELLELDFDFDNGYMFNSCFYEDGCIWFNDHMPGEEVDYIYAYDPDKKEWIYYKETYTAREYNGQTKIVVEKDGKEIIVF